MSVKEKYEILQEGFRACFLTEMRGKDCPYDGGWKERYWLWGWLAGEKVMISEGEFERREKDKNANTSRKRKKRNPRRAITQPRRA